MAASCDDGGDGSGDGVSSVDCNGETISLGHHCKATYKKVINCCADSAVARQTATALLCGMQGNEDACEQGGTQAAETQCSLLALRPDCAETGGDGDSDSDGGVDSDTESEPDKACEGECSSDQLQDAFCLDNDKSCMCVAENVNNETVYKWVLSDCVNDAAWCKDAGGIPRCSPENGACECSSL